MSLEEARSPALSAKQRARGPSVLERQRDEEERAALRTELAWPSRKPVSAKAVLQSETAASGGKSIKTGMVLARAQLSEHSIPTHTFFFVHISVSFRRTPIR